MIKKLECYFNRVWYQRPEPPLLLLLLSFAYQAIIQLREKCYQFNLFKTTAVNVPVIVVGNLSVGGTGKTPLVIKLAGLLQQLGYTPGIISRGYTGQLSRTEKIELVPEHADPKLFGDEAVLICSRTDCPVVIGKSRANAANHLLSISDCNVIISDDGLQHNALKRDIEILVIDGMRGFGNRHCLPAGPLREPLSRANNVDIIVCNGGDYPDAFRMDLIGNNIVNLLSKRQQPLLFFETKRFHAVTAIGNPERFFQSLKSAGLSFDTRIFPDHHQFTKEDLNFDDSYPILMTEKDAVKCYHLANTNTWMLPVDAQLDMAFIQALKHLLETKYG